MASNSTTMDMGATEVTNFTATTMSIEISTESSSTAKLADGLPQIISTIVTISFLAVALGGIYILYRLCCKTRSKHDGAESNGRNKEDFDQFDVNGSQINIESEEKKFVNRAAKITSESESSSTITSSSNAPGANSSVSRLVRSLHSDRFAVSQVRERSSRPSSLKVRLPKHFVDASSASAAEGKEDQFAFALIDHKSNTIHNIDLRDCVIVNTQANSVVTPTSALFAQKWKDKTRQRRVRRSSVDHHAKLLPRQTSCPNSMSVKGFQSESLSSHSDDSSPRDDLLGSSAMGVSLSSIDETTHKLFDDGAFGE